MKHIPERLREVRQKSGYSQSEMAAKLGVSSNTISAIEKADARDIRIGTIQAYARHTGCSVEYLIFGENYLQGTLLRFDEATEVIQRTLSRTRAILIEEREKYFKK